MHPLFLVCLTFPWMQANPVTNILHGCGGLAFWSAKIWHLWNRRGGARVCGEIWSSPWSGRLPFLFWHIAVILTYSREFFWVATRYESSVQNGRESDSTIWICSIDQILGWRPQMRRSRRCEIGGLCKSVGARERKPQIPKDLEHRLHFQYDATQEALGNLKDSV